MRDARTGTAGSTPEDGGARGRISDARACRINHVVTEVKLHLEDDWLAANRKRPYGFFTTLSEPLRNVDCLSTGQSLDVVPFEEDVNGHKYFVGLPASVNSFAADDGLSNDHLGMFPPEVACALWDEWPGLLYATVVLVGRYDDGRPRIRVYVEPGNDLGTFEGKTFRILSAIEDDECCRPMWR